MAPTTRCKFRCDSITLHGKDRAPCQVKLSAVYPNDSDGYKHSAEDHAFFNATPSGSLELYIQNPYGAELFQPGEFFYLDISKVPAPADAS